MVGLVGSGPENDWQRPVAYACGGVMALVDDWNTDSERWHAMSLLLNCICWQINRLGLLGYLHFVVPFWTVCKKNCIFLQDFHTRSKCTDWPGNKARIGTETTEISWIPGLIKNPFNCFEFLYDRHFGWHLWRKFEPLTKSELCMTWWFIYSSRNHFIGNPLNFMKSWLHLRHCCSFACRNFFRPTFQMETLYCVKHDISLIIVTKFLSLKLVHMYCIALHYVKQLVTRHLSVSEITNRRRGRVTRLSRYDTE